MEDDLLKDALAQVFSYEFCEIFKNNFFIKHLWWLLLTVKNKDAFRTLLNIYAGTVCEIFNNF